MKPSFRQTFALLFLLLPTLSLAEETLPWYQVEILVFTQQDLYGDEKHRTDVELSYPQKWLTLEGSELRIPPAPLLETSEVATELPDNVSSAVVDASGPEGISKADTSTDKAKSFVLLDKKDYEFGPENYTLGRAPGYRVLLHWAWRQPGLDIDNSPWVLLAGGEQYGEHHELEGSLRIVLNRYLHVQANLWHTRFGQLQPAMPVTEATIEQSDLEADDQQNTVDNAVSPSWPALPGQPWRETVVAPQSGTDFPESINQADTPAWTFETPKFSINDLVTLNQSTRLQLGELTYLDHPNLGVLVLVNRYENSEENTP